MDGASDGVPSDASVQTGSGGVHDQLAASLIRNGLPRSVVTVLLYLPAETWRWSSLSQAINVASRRIVGKRWRQIGIPNWICKIIMNN